MRRVRRVLAFDAAAGLIEVEAGIEWPESIDYLEGAPTPNGQRWSIRQKQTRADRLSLGGCLAANIHGRGLRMRPFIFYLTYSRAASADQVRACYPNFAQFLEAKRRFDPQQRFQSNWYRTCFAPTCLIVRGRP